MTRQGDRGSEPQIEPYRRPVIVAHRLDMARLAAQEDVGGEIAAPQPGAIGRLDVDLARGRGEVEEAPLIAEAAVRIIVGNRHVEVEAARANAKRLHDP